MGVIHGRHIQPLRLLERLFGAREIFPTVAGRLRKQDPAARKVKHACTVVALQPGLDRDRHHKVQFVGGDGQVPYRDRAEEPTSGIALRADFAAEEARDVERGFVADAQQEIPASANSDDLRAHGSTCHRGNFVHRSPLAPVRRAPPTG